MAKDLAILVTGEWGRTGAWLLVIGIYGALWACLLASLIRFLCGLTIRSLRLLGVHADRCLFLLVLSSGAVPAGTSGESLSVLDCPTSPRSTR